MDKSKTELKAGDTVTVYEDPITREKEEGRAVLLHYHYTDDELGERWEVSFEGEEMIVGRWIR